MMLESIEATRPLDVAASRHDPQHGAADEARRGRAEHAGVEPARAVIRWNAFASNLVAANLPPGPQTYVLAITHIAMHDALNAIEPKYKPYAYTGSARGASVAAAVAAAARDCLLRLMPQAAAAIEAEYAKALASVADATAKSTGVATGQAAAAAILELRSADDLNAAITKPYTPGAPVPGVYQLTAPLNFVLLAGWSELRPFALTSARQFRSPAPLAVKSFQYARDYREVKRLGGAGSTVRSAQQSQTAQFWYDVATKEWHVAARKALADAGASEWRAARLLAVLSIAMADVGIASFDAKFEYQYWRPITAIRAGNADGNPATAGDPQWEPLCVTPPFPEYNSTHAATAAAAAVALGRELGDRHDFHVASPTLPGVSRSYRRFSTAAYEEGLSRIYCGIHFRHAMSAGFTQGAQVSRFVDDNLLPRLD
jgi:membrane-associated phospholipid phosphatase